MLPHRFRRESSMSMVKGRSRSPVLTDLYPLESSFGSSISPTTTSTFNEEVLSLFSSPSPSFHTLYYQQCQRHHLAQLHQFVRAHIPNLSDIPGQKANYSGVFDPWPASTPSSRRGSITETPDFSHKRQRHRSQVQATELHREFCPRKLNLRGCDALSRGLGSKRIRRWNMDPSIVCKEETVETSSGEDGQKEGKTEKLLNKYCAVCGDKALGYNFNALTCESCKAFFRRNALKNKEFKCPFSNKCEVTLVTRRFCQKCRLRKCFDIGMKKEWILSDEEKQQKRQKIEQNRAKKRQDVPDLSPGASLAVVSPSTLPHTRDVVSPASTSISFPLGTDSIGLERPQARVLPSSRPPSEDDNQPRQKLMRYEIPDESNSRSRLAGDPYSSNDSSEQCTLIRHELTASNSPPQNSTFIPTIHDRSQINMLNFVVQQPQLSAHSSSKDLPLDASVNPSTLTRMSPDLTTLTASLPEQVNPMNLDVKSEQSPQSYPSTSCDQNPFSTHMGGIPLVGAMTEIKSSDSSLSFPDITNTSFDNLDDIVTVAIEAEFHVQNIHSTMHSLTGKSLNDRETDRLHELFMASRSLVEPLDLEKSPYSNADPKNLISVVNLTDLAIKRIIRMAKKINPFITMCQEDQIALLKGGCTELMILRSVINYNPDKNSWRIPSKDRPREVNMELLKEASHLGVNLYEEHQRFVKSFDPKWRTDENVMLLLSAIALFNPSRTNVLHKDVVKLEQDAYYYLLRRYLETICTGCDARRVYLHLIGRLKDLNRLNESHIQLFLGLNPKLVEPLLIEIFDLKPTP